MSLKILHVLDHSAPLHSGYTFRTLAILREQRRLGWQTLQLTSPKHYGAKADDEESDGFRFHRTRVPAMGWRRWPLLDQWSVIHDTRRRLSGLIRDHRPDLLHAHSPCLNGIAAIQAGRHFRIPVVYEMRASWEDAAVDHGTTTQGSLRYKLSRSLETWTLRRADAVTTICEGLRRDIAGRGIAEDRITVIPNAVDPQGFQLLGPSDPAIRARLGLESTDFVLGFIGSFYAYEGLDTLLDAMPSILEAVPGARVLLVGGGYEEARLREQAGRLGIGQRVIFAGRVSHEEVARYYSAVDLLVYPRKRIRLTETVTPLKPLEAMAQGRLLMASDVGGHRELVSDGVNGYLFPPDQPAALAAAVARICADRHRWSNIVAAGRRYIETERNWRTSVAGYREVYERAGAGVGAVATITG
jgi:PEP-CTERM/exosortase A-associated glycosyltransferase